MKARKCGIFAHWLPNGNIRFFTGDERQGGGKRDAVNKRA